jgi:hypothetical protein
MFSTVKICCCEVFTHKDETEVLYPVVESTSSLPKGVKSTRGTDKLKFCDPIKRVQNIIIELHIFKSENMLLSFHP